MILLNSIIGASGKCSGLAVGVYSRGNGSALPGKPDHVASPSFLAGCTNNCATTNVEIPMMKLSKRSLLIEPISQ